MTSLRWTEADLADYERRRTGGRVEPARPPSNKFHARKTAYDGRVFDSRKEARRYQELQLRQHAREIVGLRHHVTFPLAVNGVHICTYEADFVYWVITDTGARRVVEDVKSDPTRRLPAYRYKRALMLALYGITIEEV